MSIEQTPNDDYQKDLRRLACAAIRGRSGVDEYLEGQRQYICELDELMRNSVREGRDSEADDYRARLRAERQKLDRLLESVRTAEEESEFLRRALDREEERLGRLITSDDDEKSQIARRVGTNLRGVPIYEGGNRRPELSECFHALGRSIVLITLSGFALFDLAPYGNLNAISLIVVLLAIFAIVIGLISFFDCIGLSSQRARLRGLVSIAEAESQFKVPGLTLLLVARQEGIEPRCILNGTEYFAFSDFGDAATLLRAAERPDGRTDHLLQPVRRSETEPALLLRTTNDEQHPTTKSSR